MNFKQYLIPYYLLMGTINPVWFYYLLTISVRIIACVQYCVTWYFVIFVNIFTGCLNTIKVLISDYLTYLTYLTYRLTLYPTNLIFVTGATVMLYIIRLILHDLVPYRNKQLNH